MKRLRVVATPDPAVAPRPFELLADSSAIAETRLVEANLGGDVGPTMLFTVDGAYDDLPAALRAEPATHRVELTPIDDARAVLMLTIDTEELPLAAALFEAFTRSGIVVEMPVVYREGSVHATLLGESGTLQSMLSALPDAVSVDVREVGEFVGREPSSVLSDRQHEAVRTGLELGYYDVPRGATHEDVAERLDCSPSTASEHLQKAEAKLVQASMGEARSRAMRDGARE